ncbi:hypothetical protein [Arthrobacter sp. ISL-95]|uniref:hypothetical protein n=1 Tax=Arthrobacter sp. ISL-95 TaxID=2819116 RepID=UPI001BECE4B3|nr:hypothetical protein [Arthrobacter sp. ISL-95]MBT2587900.1 hypothetical protein [Arthrobacter sp. ISL-95]
MLTNAVEISKEAANIDHPKVVMIAYQPSSDGSKGEVYVYGCGRYAAGRTKAVLEGLPSSDALSASITRDHAAELSSVLRKQSRSASALIGVTMAEQAFEGKNPETGVSSWGSFAVMSGELYLTHLHDADASGKYDSIWTRVDDLASEPGDPLTALALQTNVLSRVGKVKGVGDAIDFRTTPLPGVIAAKLGANFVALLGEINRGSFATGGKWGNGPGTADQLWPAASV